MGKINQKFTYEYVKDIIETEGYKLISTRYINANTHIEIECPKGHRYFTKLGNFRTGCRCSKCVDRTKKKLSYDTVKSNIESEGYVLLSTEYSGARDKLKVKCPKGHEYLVTYDKFKQGKRCPYCCHNHKIDITYIKEKAEKHGYTILDSQYVNAHSELTLQCPKNHIFKLKWVNFHTGTRCPICGMSAGETRIMNYLEKNSIEYIPQYRFKDCKNIYRLPFDFYLPEYFMCIEYDGEQHFKPIDFGGQGDDISNIKFNILKRNDKIKTEYCKTNGINLLRISYTDYNNIEKILHNELIRINFND